VLDGDAGCQDPAHELSYKVDRRRGQPLQDPPIERIERSDGGIGGLVPKSRPGKSLRRCDAGKPIRDGLPKGCATASTGEEDQGEHEVQPYQLVLRFVSPMTRMHAQIRVRPAGT
jgi:hypothetical protein